jgi:hypothetical protein
MTESEMLQHCVKALGMRHVVTALADMSDEEAQRFLLRGDRVRAYAASQAVRVLRRVLRELPTSSTVGQPAQPPR